MEKIQEALDKRFRDHRVIFWYDEKKEFSEIFESLDIDQVEKIEVNSNEFEVKYKILKNSNSTKFLLYLPFEKPHNEENWLLDLELANHLFHTDQEAMFLQELGLDYYLKDLVSEHIEFFKSKERKQKLKTLLTKGDEQHEIRCKMLSVAFNTDTTNLDQFVQAYSSQLVVKSKDFDKPLDRFNLNDFFWSEIGKIYNYHSDKPSIYDFLLDLFQHNFVLGDNQNLSTESRLILSTWKNTIPYRDYFGEISEKVAGDIQVEEKLSSAQLDEIIGDDIFKLTDQRIIHELVSQLVDGNLSYDRVSAYIKRRENKFWYQEYSEFYNTIESGAQLIDLVKKYANYEFNNFDNGIKEYTNKYYQVDYAYRKFIWNYRLTKNNNVLQELAEKIEKIYNNSWLLPYNDNWQQLIDNIEAWPTDRIESQQGFFKNHVKPLLDKNQKLFVIISDALRFECGVELHEMIVSENRFESNLEFMVSSLPSYTQLGMASLLPHSGLEVKKGGDSLIVDQMSASGLKGRSKILQVNSGVRATTILAEDLMKMKTKSGGEGREFVKDHDLIYIYHNRIDKTGDDKTSEGKVFEAVADELIYLKDILRKISGLNGTNVFITADHGFIYQNQKLDESDFSLSEYEGDVWKENRRFVIGENLKGDKNTKKFNAAELNLNNENLEVLIPKSINRLRIKGAGSRFIHGGATPQEVIVPLLKTAVRKRTDTVSLVNIDIIKSTDRITTNILPVSFIQQDLVGEKILPRHIRAGIYAEDGELLSDQFTFQFDIEEGSERQREVKHQFHLSKKAGGKYKNQRVRLILEEPLEGTTKWKKYRDFYYTLNITFSSDFD
ncbi:BREX-1 system phosphatase PglZ type A [Christiangramia echinicola]|uniref:TIGR02687 family protein n=1 Tax=Christiangramia echinicola TaxID=279359 RepID=A0A1H1RKL1_9FLAO|nr:BREX-1 system phosphatase PglZ type A [Christiangramia echinicola]SDS36240.1 TIGR02687 family protein [Christiangramia echinicola]